jgi:4-hydroxy-2-oxoheptanedioate aldolase
MDERMPPSLKQILRNTVKEKLARDEVVASMTVRLVRNVEIARIAATCGFDTIYVDVEHSTFSLDTTSQICIAALDAGITPFVRVPSHGPEYICRALDGGALGVIAPHIRSAAEAAAVVRCAKYPPQGERSAGGPLAQYQFRDFPVAEANQAANDATMVIAMMETRDALANVEEIAAVDGVDMLFIGTNDLCGDLGIHGQYDHKLVHEAYARTIAACRARGKHVGVGGLGSRPDLIVEFVGQGARYVSIGADLSFLLGAGREKAEFVHALKH